MMIEEREVKNCIDIAVNEMAVHLRTHIVDCGIDEQSNVYVILQFMNWQIIADLNGVSYVDIEV